MDLFSLLSLLRPSGAARPLPPVTEEGVARRLAAAAPVREAAARRLTLSDPLSAAVDRARRALLARQHEEGYWVAELEADVTLTAEYLLLRHFLGIVDRERERKGVRYILAHQGADGGWPIYHGGPGDISCTAKAYLALRAAGLPASDPALTAARRFVLERGGLPAVNTFTKVQFALVGQFAWRSVPAIPVEMVLLPRASPFNLYEISYWSRTTLVPLAILAALRPVRRLPGDAGRGELVASPRDEAPPLPPLARPVLSWRNLFLAIERACKLYERRPPAWLRRRAIEAAVAWMTPRMGEGGLGAIYPAMANAVMALHCLGRPLDDPLVARGLAALEGLVLEDADTLRVQPCLSPVWDTALAMHALAAAGLPPDHPALRRAARWLAGRQIRRPGDWAAKAPPVEPGGFPFQFENDFYPDTDDTAVAVMALVRAARPETNLERLVVARGFRWLLAMQSSDGGFGAFDVDNTRVVFNQIPFADHGALLDPPTADVTARCVEAMGVLGYGPDFPPAARALAFLKRQQEPDGSWYGRWGVNYLYGTWSVLAGLRAIGEPADQPAVRRAVAWLLAHQNADGGFGESCRSYEDRAAAGTGPSTPSQTAWALLALLHAGCGDHPAAARAADYLLRAQRPDGGWDEEAFTGTGFPRVFYLRYHLYRYYFPLWALGLYRSLRQPGG
ncbi:MAG TPA: squalene--hopene cyclase [Thermodesulfobacteriota bacterium]|nr:squalene--hopene cyclase [Thermodesulfobacteriota bacterium]